MVPSLLPWIIIKLPSEEFNKTGFCWICIQLRNQLNVIGFPSCVTQRKTFIFFFIFSAVKQMNCRKKKKNICVHNQIFLIFKLFTSDLYYTIEILSNDKSIIIFHEYVRQLRHYNCIYRIPYRCRIYESYLKIKDSI